MSDSEIVIHSEFIEFEIDAEDVAIAWSEITGAQIEARHIIPMLEYLKLT